MFSEGPSASPEKIATNHPCFEWWDLTIDWAEERGFFTQQEKDYAQNWDMCYVGRAKCVFGIEYNKLSRQEENTGIQAGPRDWSLNSMGAYFFSAVQHDKFAEARDTAKRIKEYILITSVK